MHMLFHANAPVWRHFIFFKSCNIKNMRKRTFGYVLSENSDLSSLGAHIRRYFCLMFRHILWVYTCAAWKCDMMTQITEIRSAGTSTLSDFDFHYVHERSLRPRVSLSTGIRSDCVESWLTLVFNGVHSTKHFIHVTGQLSRLKYIYSRSFRYSRNSMARTYLGPWNCFRDMGKSSHWGLIIAPG